MPILDEVMNLKPRSYKHVDAEAWDAFCGAAYQATFLHSRRYLSYHGERFVDRSLVLECEKKWMGIFPAALQPNDDSCVVSHPGITYGGILHKKELVGERMITALSMICEHYAEQGYEKLRYKATPWFYHTTPAQDDIYALYRIGAQRIRCDLSSTIDLKNRQPVSNRRKRSLKKALRAVTEVSEGIEYLPDFWKVLADNLKQKHQTTPVHTLAEITTLAERFPDSIRCVVGYVDGALVAGVLLFKTSTTTHAQYIASSSAGYDVSALDAIFEHCILQALNEGKRWFNFGVSTESGGHVLNDGLYRFKSEFGGGGAVHEFFEIDLRKVTDVA